MSGAGMNWIRERTFASGHHLGIAQTKNGYMLVEEISGDREVLQRAETLRTLELVYDARVLHWQVYYAHGR